MVMAPPRLAPRVQRRAAAARASAGRGREASLATGDADKEPAARRSLDKDAPSFGAVTSPRWI